MNEAFAPCDCRLSREAAMTCARKSRGQLIWTPESDGGGQPYGPVEMVSLNGAREPLVFNGEEWAHWSEGLARDHAAIRHLDFVTA